MLPLSLDATVPGFEAARAGAQGALLAVGAAALAAVLTELPAHARASAAAAAGVTAVGSTATADADAGLARALLDESAALEAGATAASVLRLASYGGSDGGDGDGVMFQPHTDGTWFTVIPVSVVPGLEGEIVRAQRGSEARTLCR